MTSLAESLTLESLERDPDPILARLRDTDGGDVELHGFEFRGPRALNVRWDV